MSKHKSSTKPAGTTSSSQGGTPDPQEINRLLGLYNEGRFDEACFIADAMTARYPRFGFGWKVLGVLLCQTGRVAEAVEPMRKSAALSVGDPEAHFNLGNVLRDLGQFAEALASYRRAVAIDANFAEAFSNMGTTQQVLGRNGDAVASYRRAVALMPDSAGAHFNLGNALNDLGRFDDAIASYRRALELAPDYAEAHVNLGTSLSAAGRRDDAVESYRRAIAIAPDLAEAHCKLGDALHGLGQFENAMASYQRAVSIDPKFAEAYNSLGTAMQNLGRFDEALECLGKALSLQPDFAEAHYNRGAALQTQGRLDEAAECFQRAVQIKPDFAEAHNNLGHVLHGLGRPQEAVSSFNRALAIKPDLFLAHSNLGASLQELGRIEDAVASFGRALAINPDYPDAHYNLGNAFRDLGQLDDSVKSYRQALVARPSYPSANSNLIFTLGYHALVPPRDLLAEARQWQMRIMPKEYMEAARLREFHVAPRIGRRLRVGYVSGDFRGRHPVSYFIEPLFRLHDRCRVELFAYTTTSGEDTVTERLKGLVDHWVPIAGLSDEAARKRIEVDGIDILIDLSGHSALNRLGLFALRAAPVQAHYLGYFATTGLTEMDYWLGDPVILPEAEDEHFSEKIWRLPRVWISYQAQDDAPPSKWHPSEDGTVWLGSFNNLYKLTKETLALWAKILVALPSGKLLLKTKGLGDPATRKRILDVMGTHGIGAERLELIDRTDDWASHMALYDRLDIALDPVGGIGGGTTTCDALWMGVPVVTLLGQQMPQRMTASMLDAIGHREWIAESESAYIGKVVALAGDIEQRVALRPGQREKMRSSPLCDAAGLAHSLEDAYEAMFDAWWRKKSDMGMANTDNRPC
jgi:protein O-GlcNAc transferase